MSARRLSPEARARYVRIPLGQLPGQSGARPGYRALAYRAVVQPRDAPGACRGSRPFRRVGLDDPIPRNLTGCAVALADKFDSVVGCLAVGVVPTGSSDPYALRRAALGIVKIILEKKLPVSLSLAIAAAGKALLTHKPKRGVTPDQETQILDFILDRAKFVFRERDGFAYEEVSAVC